MSIKHGLTRAQKTILLKNLILMANSDNHIPFSVTEISSKLQEALGRDVSNTTIRTYLRDAGFTCESVNSYLRPGRQDRICQLARIVKEMALQLDVQDVDLLKSLQCIIDKQSVKSAPQNSARIEIQRIFNET